MKHILLFIGTFFICQTGIAQTNNFSSSGDVTLLSGNKLVYDHLYYVHGYTTYDYSGMPEAAMLNYGYYGHRFATRNGVALVLRGDNNFIGLGTATPVSRLDVRGSLTLEAEGDASIYTGTSPQESNRFLRLLNSPAYQSASGLKAGGILVSDSYDYATPSKNDMVVKGNVSIGSAHSEGFKLAVAGDIKAGGNITIETGGNASIYTGTMSQESNRFLQLLNSSDHRSASGLKAGGVLVSDSYDYANPSKSDMVVKGNVSIGTPNHQGYKLAVAGNVIAESIKVAVEGNWPDYVFSPSYKLSSLQETEQFIKINNHLPEIPSASEVEKEGINLGEMNSKLLKKIEELTLYLIEQNKRASALETRMKVQEEFISMQQREIDILKSKNETK
jgi:uncharacterized protein YaiE (UPF0345 family)